MTDTNNQQPTQEEIQRAKEAFEADCKSGFELQYGKEIADTIRKALSSLGSQPLKSMEEFTKELENEGHGPLLEKGRAWLAQKIGSQTDVDVRTLKIETFEHIIENTTASQMQHAVNAAIDYLAERGLLKTGETG